MGEDEDLVEQVQREAKGRDLGDSPEPEETSVAGEAAPETRGAPAPQRDEEEGTQP